MLLLPELKTFQASLKPCGRKHTRTRSMMGLSELTSTNVETHWLQFFWSKAVGFGWLAAMFWIRVVVFC